MKINNKKGELTLFVLAPYIIGVGYAVVAYGATQADYSLNSFRNRKAVEYCVQEGGTNCADTVSKMSKAEVLVYIKDTQERPRF